MGKIEDFAALHSADDDRMELARFVRTMEGARRFRTAIGAIIQDKPAMPSGARSTAPSNGDIQEKVAALRKALAKLDANAIKGILSQMQKSKDLPHNKRYDLVKEMLEDFLKDKLKKTNEAAKYAARNTAREGVNQATGQG